MSKSQQNGKNSGSNILHHPLALGGSFIQSVPNKKQLEGTKLQLDGSHGSIGKLIGNSTQDSAQIIYLNLSPKDNIDKIVDAGVCGNFK